MHSFQEYLEESKLHSLQERSEELRQKLGNDFEYRHTTQDFGRYLIIEVSKKNSLDHSMTRVQLRFNNCSVRNPISPNKINECRIFLDSEVDEDREIDVD